jgi:hypothetical protein
MNSPETNDPIEKLLREEDTYIADDGFTKRVMEKLPERRVFWPRVVLLVLIAIGAVLAGCWLPWGSLLDFRQALALDPKLLSAWLAVGAVITALVSGVLLAQRRD